MCASLQCCIASCQLLDATACTTVLLLPAILSIQYALHLSTCLILLAYLLLLCFPVCCTLYLLTLQHIFCAADEYACDGLKAAALSKIVSTFPLASKTEGFALLDERQLMLILSDDNVVDCDESVVFDAVSFAVMIICCTC